MNAVAKPALALIDSNTIREQLRTQRTKLTRAGKLPLDCMAAIAIAIMEIAEKRIASLSAELIKERCIPGWDGWVQIASGWLLRISEDDEAVRLYLCRPADCAGRGSANVELSVHFKTPRDTSNAQCLRKLRKALGESV